MKIPNSIHVVALVLFGAAMVANAATMRLQSPSLTVEIDTGTGAWALTDVRSGVRWPTAGMASAGSAECFQEEFSEAEEKGKAVVLREKNGAEVAFRLVNDGSSLEIRYAGRDIDEVSVLDDALAITDTEKGYVVVPSREGLLIPADSGVSFKRTFGTSDYEGCHMNMLGFAKSGSALLADWDDAYTFPDIKSALLENGPAKQRLTTSFRLRRTARAVRLTPLGAGDWNAIAAGYRRIAERKGLAVTLRQKIERNPHLAKLIGASNVKLWTCLARRMSEDSKKEESVTVRWTFDEAARIAEHLKKDVGVDRALFMMGGWTEGGYDCRHPDNLPANSECGGNEALADAVRRIQDIGYVGCLHDNVQDMYGDAESFDLGFMEKDAKGNPKKGGRWLGGRAWMVCAQKQFELAKRPQNLAEISRLFQPWSYFIDTTFAVGPRECSDPAHPLDRNSDIAWKQKLSDFARETFGLFGSECGREWALPHSDFFEGLVAVSGRYYHNLDPASLGAMVIPFWEMVYHDCQIAYGKYGYAADHAAECVAHHALCARPFYYHSIPDHLYWTQKGDVRQAKAKVRPRVVDVKPAGDQKFQIRYAWDVEAEVKGDWRIFVHFGTDKKILFQNDHAAEPPTSQWGAGRTLIFGPHTVTVPPSVQDKAVNVYLGFFSPVDGAPRVPIAGGDSQHRILAGRLVLSPEIRFELAKAGAAEPPRDAYVRNDGWAKGLHPADVLIKNTHELLAPLHAATAHMRLARLEFLTPDRTVRRAVYGSGDDAVTVVANFGRADATVETKLGGAVVLPPWGVVIDATHFAGFYAKRWGGRDYPDGALFTLQSLDGQPLASSGRVRVFRGFGPAELVWRGRTWTIEREQTIAPGLLDANSSERLGLPSVSEGKPAAGKLVLVTSPEYAGTEVYHLLYLPKDWTPDWREMDRHLPVIFEYTGNYFPTSGSTGEVKDAALGYGLSGGKFIWVSLPYIRKDGKANQVSWWGDVEKTVRYAKTNVPRVLDEFGGDPNAVFLCGFSRGAIGVNYLGLHDDEVAGLWTGFITHDHFDGVKQWGGTDWGSPLEKYRIEAAERLKRIGGRPYLVSQNGTTRETEKFTRSVLPSVENFTFQNISTREILGEFPNEIAKHSHTDRWPLVPSRYRTATWEWFNRVVGNQTGNGRVSNTPQ